MKLLEFGLLDAYIAMIPKADGDFAPFGQRPLSVLPVVYRLWASHRLGHLREWVEGWLPKRPGSLLRWILRRFFLGLVVISCMLWSLMSLSLVILLIGLFLDCDLSRLGLPDWFRYAYFSFHCQVRLRFKLAAGLGDSWCRDGGIFQGCSLSMVFTVSLYVLWCRYFESQPNVKPQRFADNFNCSAERPRA